MMLGFDLHQNENLCTTRFPVTSFNEFWRRHYYSLNGVMLYIVGSVALESGAENEVARSYILFFLGHVTFFLGTYEIM